MTTLGRGNPETEGRLQATAIDLFARKWYGTVSVAEICRAAGLSNGVFYRYFNSKEALFKVILGGVLEWIRTALDGLRGETPRQRLDHLADLVVNLSSENPGLVSVFREGQYRYLEFEQRLVAIYTRSLGAALGQEVGLAEYLFAFGGLRFCGVRKAFFAVPVDLGTVRGILAEGLFRGLTFDPARVFGGMATPAAGPPGRRSAGAPAPLRAPAVRRERATSRPRSTR